MLDWQEMAGEVCRKLVETGQTRILQRIHEGIMSNWILDVADEKSSIDHLLIHLVWRKFPRNRHSAEEQRQTAVSTQTKEGSSAELGLGTSAGLTRLPRETLDQQDCYSGSDLGKLFEAEISFSFSDAGSSSDFYSPGLVESERTSLEYSPENTSFMPPSKRRTGKPLNSEKKFQPELSNRFGCLDEVNSPETFKVNSTSTDRKSITVSHGNRSRSPSKTEPKLKMPDIPKASLTKSRESSLTSEIPSTTTQEANSSSLRKGGRVTCFKPKHQYGYITPDIFIPGREPNLNIPQELATSIYFHRIYDDPEIKQGDKVSFFFDFFSNEAKDIRVIENG